MVLTRRQHDPGTNDSPTAVPGHTPVSGRKRGRDGTSDQTPRAKRQNRTSTSTEQSRTPRHLPAGTTSASDGDFLPGQTSSTDYTNRDASSRNGATLTPGTSAGRGQIGFGQDEQLEGSTFVADGSSPLQQHIEGGLPQKPDYMPLNANIHVRLQSLPVLENLATQVLSIIAKLSYPEIINMAIRKDSDAGKTYLTLKNLFNHAKQVYSHNDPFLNARALGFVNHAHIETIRKANIATFMISVLGSQDVGFYHLNEFFLDTFLAEGQSLTMPLGELLIELKTQAYISALSNKDRPKEAILEDLFPLEMGDRFLQRRHGARTLTQSEDEFMQRFRTRRKALLEEPSTENATENAVSSLPEQYVWADFLREISAYLSSNIDAIISGQQLNLIHGPRHRTHGGDDDIAGKAQRAAQYAMRDYGSSLTHDGQNAGLQAIGSGEMISSGLQGPELQFHFENELHPNVPGPQMPFFGPHTDIPFQWTPASEPSNYVPYPTQSAPSHVLYERARLAAASKSSPNAARRPPQPSTRRPWSLEEENALMAGLDRVRGPHWSQIIGMFGKGGSISEVLKDRGQVNLKDKARNLKLFFLKHDIEVPYYLQCVTGELKTRAPGTAAKKEARARGLSDDDRAHVEGIMALANSSQQRVEDPAAQQSQNRAESSKAHEQNINTDNLDPNLSSMSQNSINFAARTFNADWIMPMGNAPSANMTRDQTQSLQGAHPG